MKTAIIYYSYEGNTKCIAETLAKEINCDIFEIKAKKDISTKGFFKYIWGGKQALMKESPDLEALNFNVNDYDRLFIGTPVWAWTVSPVVRSFVQKYCENKFIYVFYTYEGGDQGFYEKVEELVNKKNRLIGVHGFMNVIKEKDLCLNLCHEWAQEVKKTYKL